MTKAVEEILNNQINKEFYSAYLYLSMSVYFADKGLAGFANWFRAQAQEEQAHAMMIFDYMLSRSFKVTLKAIDEPEKTWNTNLEVAKNVLEHEIYVTSLINNIVNVAEENKDRATQIFFDWFISEQIEEEASAKELVDKLELIGDDKSALFMLDKDLSTRVFTPPVS